MQGHERARLGRDKKLAVSVGLGVWSMGMGFHASQAVNYEARMTLNFLLPLLSTCWDCSLQHHAQTLPLSEKD